MFQVIEYILQCVLCVGLSYRGINFVLSALVFNVFPTIFEVSLVSGILVCSLYLLLV